jgi:hypothetical protein
MEDHFNSPKKTPWSFVSNLQLLLSTRFFVSQHFSIGEKVQFIGDSFNLFVNLDLVLKFIAIFGW